MPTLPVRPPARRSLDPLYLVAVLTLDQVADLDDALEAGVRALVPVGINAGLTQRELAKRAGPASGAVWNIEHRGQPAHRP